MRALGFTLTAVLIGAATTWAQQPRAPMAPTAPPVVPVGAPAPNALDTHLAGWERTMSGIVNFRFEIELTKSDAVFKKEQKYKGVVLCLKPNYAILRLDNIGDPTKTDYEAYICNGKSLFRYVGVEKSITEFKLPPPNPNGGGGTDNLMLDFLTGLKAVEAKQRFELAVFKEDENYVYLDIKPRRPQDRQEFQLVRMALYGPNLKNLAYLPRSVLIVKPGTGDTESFSFTDPRTNLPGIDANVFQYKAIPGWNVKQAPAQPQGARPGQPPMLPGGTGLPAGPGVVRP